MRILPKLLLSVVVVIALWIPLLFGVSRTIQVRIDTGDLRYCYSGVPYSYERTEDETRRRLLSVAKLEPRIPPEWCTVFTGAPDVEDNPHWSCRGFYYEASAWVPVDSHIARFAVEDIAGYVRTIHIHGGPRSGAIFWPIVDRSDPNRLQVIPGWRENRDVLYYLDSKGYAPPPPSDDPVSIKDRLQRQAQSDRNYLKDTPVHLAVLGGYTEVARLLLREGADVDATNERGETPLELAAWRGNPQLVELLLVHGARANHDNRALREAARYGHRDVAELLLAAGARHDAFTAAGLGAKSVLETLLDETPGLVDAKVGRDQSFLHLAVRNGHVETARLLLAKGARVDAPARRDTPLHAAALAGHLEMAELCLKAGADINACGWDGDTPLHRAAQGGHQQMAELLLSHGADRAARGGPWDKATASDYALRHGHAALAKLLR